MSASPLLSALGTTLVILAASCGDSGTCANDLPTCPSDPPSFKGEVAPIIASKCSSQCHSPSGQDQVPTLLTYAQIHAQRSSVLNQTYHCVMPPSDGTAKADLTSDERATLLEWLVCEAPDN